VFQIWQLPCCDNSSIFNTPQLTYKNSRHITIALNEQYINTITKYLLKVPMNCMGRRPWNGKRSFEISLQHLIADESTVFEFYVER
jgi:hypothetical protein